MVAKDNVATLLLPVHITIGLSALWIGTAVAYHLAKYYKLPQLLTAITSAVVFVLCAGQEQVIIVSRGLTNAVMKDAPLAIVPSELMGARGILAAVFIAVAVVELQRLFVYWSKFPKLPAAIPPAVLPSILGMSAVGVTVLTVMAVNEICHALIGAGLGLALSIALDPLLLVAGSLPFVLLIVFLSQWIWFMGMHGCNTTAFIIAPFMTIFLLLNAGMLMAGSAPVFAFTNPFWTCTVIVGGNGATLGLALIARYFAQSSQLKEASRQAVGSVAFNINELIVFGFPVIQNKSFLWPYLFVPVINAAITYECIANGLMRAAFCPIPWVVPGPIGALLAAFDWRAMILIMALIVLDALLYLPFFLKYDKELQLQENNK